MASTNTCDRVQKQVHQAFVTISQSAHVESYGGICGDQLRNKSPEFQTFHEVVMNGQYVPHLVVMFLVSTGWWRYTIFIYLCRFHDNLTNNFG